MGILSDFFDAITGTQKLDKMGLFTPVAMPWDNKDEYGVVNVFDGNIGEDNHKVVKCLFDKNTGEVIVTD